MNKVAKVKDLIKFLEQFDPETDVVLENFEWGNEPLLISDLNYKEAWLTNWKYKRTFQGKDYENSEPAILL